MRIEGLRALHASMRENGVSQQKFKHVVDTRASFTVLFSVRGNPFSLAMTEEYKGDFFHFDVLPGYRIAFPLDDDVYKRLATIMRIHSTTFEPFNPRAFFHEFNASIPDKATRDRVPSVEDMVRLRRDLPDPDSPYFLTWLRNDLQNNKVTKRNYLKTLELLGEEAAEYSLRENVSSCWTNDPARRRTWRESISF